MPEPRTRAVTKNHTRYLKFKLVGKQVYIIEMKVIKMTDAYCIRPTSHGKSSSQDWSFMFNGKYLPTTFLVDFNFTLSIYKTVLETRC